MKRRRRVADGALVRAHLEGEPEAFRRLYERFFVRLVALCSRHVPDAATAEDLAQDTLVRAFEAIESFDTDRPMWPWLKRIAGNLALDHVRKHSRSVPSGLLEDELSGCQAAFDPGPAGDSDFTDRLAEQWLVMFALAQIPARQAAALELCYLEGWSQRDAADILGASSNAFKQLLFRARRSLAEEYRTRFAPSSFVPHSSRDGSVGEFSPSIESETRILRLTGACGFGIQDDDDATCTASVTSRVATRPD